MYSTIDNYKEKKNTFYILFFLVIVSILSVKLAKVAFLFALVLFIYAFYQTVKTKNAFGYAHIFAAYFMAAEVFFRMSWSGLPWEFSKYAVIILLLSGYILDKHIRSFSILNLIFILLLLPAIYLTYEYYDDSFVFRKRLIFNLLGPIVLFVSVLYFYKLKININEFVKLSRAIIFGVFSMSIFVLFKVGNYANIDYTFSSNADASGGFSGNQVSIMFGLGVLILAINLVKNQRVFYYKLFDISLLLLFLFQALMTFSRGGLFGAIIALLFGMFFYYFSNFSQLILFLRKIFFKIVLIVLGGIGVFYVVNDITDNKIYSRYFNEDKYGKKLKDDYTTGRGNIIQGDLNLFYENSFTGVGIGVSILERKEHKNYAAHVEYTRLLAEHGILGLLAVVILFFLPLKQFFQLLNNPYNNFILISFSSFALLTMTHAAMRVGAIGFFFGFAFILLYSNKNEENY